MDKNIDIDVLSVIETYPKEMQEKVIYLRTLILEVCEENPEIGAIEETLKWKEPSYISAHGSTLRIAWHKKRPKSYGVYFNCKSKLISTFRELFVDKFRFEGNRAIIFTLEEDILEKELKYIILLTLTYHKRKHLSMLDA